MTEVERHRWIGEKAAMFEAAMLQGLVANRIPLGNGVGKTVIAYNNGHGTDAHYVHNVALNHAEQLYKAWNEFVK